MLYRAFGKTPLVLTLVLYKYNASGFQFSEFKPFEDITKGRTYRKTLTYSHRNTRASHAIFILYPLKPHLHLKN